MWWENDFLKIRDRKLYIDRRRAERLAGEYGTPLLVYSRRQIFSNYHKLKRIFAGCKPRELRICYAMKANSHRKILQTLRQQGAWIDAVSPGEVEAALRAGFPGRRVLFTGTSVSDEDLHRIFRFDGLTVNIDALEQLPLMRAVKKRFYRAKEIRVSVRWNPGLGRGFNPRVVTAGKRAPDGTPVKFGVEENKVLDAFEQAASFGFSPTGLHQHLGSGWVAEDYKVVQQAVERIIEMAGRVEKAGFKLEFLDFGGGFGPQYARNQTLFPLPKYASHICRQVAGSGLNIKAIAIEPGKYLVADAGVLLLKVEYLKESYGQLFACVNSGTYTSLPRPTIYQAYHEIVNCSHLRSHDMKPVTVAGNLCETGDVFGKEISLPVPKRGDILAVLCAGAYGRSMASTFNLRDIPREIFI